jgi:fructose-bisphosphate aldolase class II
VKRDNFNVADLVLLKAVFAAAQEVKVPVIVGASGGERAFMGVHQLLALARSLRGEFNLPLFLNADHTDSLPEAVEAAKAGFDAIAYCPRTRTTSLEMSKRAAP